VEQRVKSVLRTLLVASAVAVSASVQALAKDKYDVSIVRETLTAWDLAVHARVVADMKDGQTSAALKPPVKTRHRLPQYPKEAKKTDLRGMVKLTARVGTDGRIDAFVSAEGDERLVQAVRAAVEKWRYSAFRVDGVPRATRLSVEVAFGIPEPSPLTFLFQFDSKGVDLEGWVRKRADQTGVIGFRPLRAGSILVASS
jgi:TonB family protein